MKKLFIGLVSMFLLCSCNFDFLGNQTNYVTSITISPSDASMDINKTQYYTCVISPSDASNKGIIWSVGDQEIASIDSSTGVLLSKSVGTTTVRATALDGSKVFGTTTLTVEDKSIHVTSIDVSSESDTLPVEQKMNMTVTVLPANATNKSVMWYTSNSNIGYISYYGVLEGISEGKVTVYAKSVSDSTIIGSKEITITPRVPILVSSISLNHTNVTISKGINVILTTKVLPTNADDTSVTWSSSDSSIASVAQNGLVTANALGTATIYATANDSSNIQGSCLINVSETVDNVTQNALKYSAKSINETYAPAMGDQKILFIPIHMADSYCAYSWTNENLELANDFLFGAKEDTPNDWNSVKTYYETASYGLLNIEGKVTDVYNTTYTTELLNQVEGNYTTLFKMINDALNYVEENDNTINWADYDTDGNGYVDSIHFVIDCSDNNEWGSIVWPHMSSTNFEAGTQEKPSVHTYAFSNLGHFSDARTFIHEQGHVFGLQDYYNYDDTTHYSTIDYVGSADMQDTNCFDWNGYSKMTVGWVNPYYIDENADSATITIGPASTTGDYVIVGNNWNGTAFDEYFLLELFSPYGNNKDDWSSWYTRTYHKGCLTSAGVRLYHVDSRIWGYSSSFANGSFIDDVTSSSFSSHRIALSNSTNNAYTTAPTGCSNYHLLTLIQAGGTNTFGIPDTQYKTYSRFLTSDDLFMTGDEFSIEKYSTFFANETTLDDGSSFPYTIHFDSVSKDSATISFIRNA